jgi:hypothetical protein
VQADADEARRSPCAKASGTRMQRQQEDRAETEQGVASQRAPLRLRSCLRRLRIEQTGASRR